MNNDRAAILEAIRALPRPDRLRLLEQLVHEIAEDTVVDGRAVIGLFADEADLVEQVCRAAMAARERDPLRVGSD